MPELLQNMQHNYKFWKEKEKFGIHRIQDVIMMQRMWKDWLIGVISVLVYMCVNVSYCDMDLSLCVQLLNVIARPSPRADVNSSNTNCGKIN
jgi:hypothetical protein